MKRIHIATLIAVLAAVPAVATAATFFSGSEKPCFVAGNAGYSLSDAASADVIVRIDNAAANPDLRLQIIDDPTEADFLLIDDADAGNLCQDVRNVQNVRLDAQAAKPDVTVALSRAPAAYKIYVHSPRYSTQGAAALFAAMWRTSQGASVGATGALAHR